MPTPSPRVNSVDQEYWSLKVFCAVAEEQSVTLAARRLTLSQPGVSMVIHRLERRWGTALVQRKGGRLILTEAGATLYQHALAILRSARELDSQMRRLTEPTDLVVDILTRSSLATHFLPPILSEFWSEHPDVEVRVQTVSGPVVLLGNILKGGSDLAVFNRGAGVAVTSGLIVKELSQEPWIIVAGPTHPLAHEGPVSLTELAQAPFIVGTRESTHVVRLQDRLSAAGLQLRVAMELNGEAAKPVIEEGRCLGVTLRRNVEAELTSGQLCVIDVPELDLQTEIIMAYRESPPPSPTCEALIGLIAGLAAS